MSKKQILPNEIDTESLIEQINSSSISEVGSANYDNIIDFLSFYKIKTGTNKVKSSMMYKLYKAWTNEVNYGRIEFATRLNRLLNNEGNYILIDVDAINLTLKAKEVFFKTKLTGRTKNKSYKKHIESFLDNHKIVPGDYSIDGHILYYIYKVWTRIERKKRTAFSNFMTYLGFYLKFNRTNEAYSYYFYIDKQQLEVDGVTLEKAKEYSKKQRKEETKL